MADMSYTVKLSKAEPAGAVETVVQKCRLKGFLLHAESKMSSGEKVEQLIDFENGVLYILDHKEKQALMMPMPEEVNDEVGANVEYEVTEAGTLMKEKRSCRVIKIKEKSGSGVISEMEVYVTEDIPQDFGPLWKTVLAGEAGAHQALRDKVKGFPLYYQRVSLRDQTTETMEVSDVDLGDVPDKVFNLPKGYTIQSLPTTPSGPVEAL